MAPELVTIGTQQPGRIGQCRWSGWIQKAPNYFPIETQSSIWRWEADIEPWPDLATIATFSQELGESE